MKSLFINPGGIGDQILLLPTIKLLKVKYPNLEIDLITEPRSASIGLLTNLYRKVKTFDFKSKNPNVLELKKIIDRHKYKHLFITGASIKSGLIAGISSASVKVGFKSGLLSKLLFTHSVPLNKNQYTANMFADLLTPIIPDLSSFLKEKQLVPIIEISAELSEWAKSILSPKLQGMFYARKILIHPGCSKLSVQKNILKNWSTKRWATLIEKLTEDEKNIVMLIGGEDDKEIIDEIEKNLMFFAKPKNFFNLCSKDHSIEKLAALISFSDILVCNDSAPMHIGIGLRKKVVAFFGPTNPEKLIPHDHRFKAVHVDNLSCRPCLFDKRIQSCDKPVCLDVEPEKMHRTIYSLLESNSSLEIRS